MQIPMRVIGEKKKFTIEAESDETVVALKEKVRTKLRHQLKPTDPIQLMYGGEWLADHVRVREIGWSDRYFVGVEIPNSRQPGATPIDHASITVAAETQRLVAVRSVSLDESQHAAAIADDATQPIDARSARASAIARPMMEDDVFETFRYLMLKYYGWTGRKRAPTELRRYKMRWELTWEQMNDVDVLVRLGYSREIVLQIYTACEKRLDWAANVLLDEEPL